MKCIFSPFLSDSKFSDLGHFSQNCTRSRRKRGIILQEVDAFIFVFFHVLIVEVNVAINRENGDVRFHLFRFGIFSCFESDYQFVVGPRNKSECGKASFIRSEYALSQIHFLPLKSSNHSWMADFLQYSLIGRQ